MRFSEMMRRIYFLLPLRVRLQIKAKARLGYFINFTHPKTFNEKINCFKLNGYTKLHSLCADKIAVKEYVRDKGLGDILIDYHVFSRDFLYEEVTEALAKYEVIFLKANHNSGPVYRLAETDNKDKIYEAYLNVKRQLSVPFGRFNGELWYDDIEPRAFCEKAITTADGEAPPDYKFHVFNSSAGQKIILQYDYDRFSDHARTMFDSELNMLPYSVQYKNRFKRLDPPANYKRMLEIAGILSSEFSYARVDLYNEQGRIYFGEITFASDGGFARFSDRRYDFEWGEHMGLSCQKLDEIN